jgi:hypothetical protein
MDAGGRATHGAVAEKVRMRGIKTGFLPLNSPHPNPLHQERGLNLTALLGAQGDGRTPFLMDGLKLTILGVGCPLPGGHDGSF